MGGDKNANKSPAPEEIPATVDESKNQPMDKFTKIEPKEEEEKKKTPKKKATLKRRKALRNLPRGDPQGRRKGLQTNPRSRKKKKLKKEGRD